MSKSSNTDVPHAPATAAVTSAGAATAAMTSVARARHERSPFPVGLSLSLPRLARKKKWGRLLENETESADARPWVDLRRAACGQPGGGALPVPRRVGPVDGAPSTARGLPLAAVLTASILWNMTQQPGRRARRVTQVAYLALLVPLLARVGFGVAAPWEHRVLLIVGIAYAAAHVFFLVRGVRRRYAVDDFLIEHPLQRWFPCEKPTPEPA